jgi:hypothetical protein
MSAVVFQKCFRTGPFPGRRVIVNDCRMIVVSDTIVDQRLLPGSSISHRGSFGRHDLLDLAEAASEAATKIRDLPRGRGQGR